MSKRRHNFGTKRFKEKSLFIFHARIALKSLILLFVRQIARGARIGKTHKQTDRQTDKHTDRTSTVTLAHARRGLIKWVELARNRNKWLGRNTTSVYPCRSCEIPRAHVRANTEKMRDCHLVARTCDNEVGVAISIRDPYTSPFTSRCK